MSVAAELLSALEAEGVEALPVGDRLRLRRGEKLSADLVDAVRAHKGEILAELEARVWSPECLESARRFGSPSARLYPLLGLRVLTPRGPGRLLQVLGRRAAVVLEADARRAATFDSLEILP